MTTYVDPFHQAEAQFRWITQQRATGQLDEASFRNALNALRLQDAQGRWWTLQEGTGAWMMWNGAQWLPASPYPSAQTPWAQTPLAPPAPQVAYPQPAYAPQTSVPPAENKSVFGQSIKYLFITVVIFAIIGVVVVIASKGEAPPAQVFAGVGVAALLSWILTLRSLSQYWEGQVVDVREERHRYRDNDGDMRDENVRWAYIREPNGKVRRERAMGDWQVGNYLRKAKGENFVRKVN